MGIVTNVNQDIGAMSVTKHATLQIVKFLNATGQLDFVTDVSIIFGVIIVDNCVNCNTVNMIIVLNLLANVTVAKVTIGEIFVINHVYLNIAKVDSPALNQADQAAALVRTNIGEHCVKGTALVKHARIVVNQTGSVKDVLMDFGEVTVKISVNYLNVGTLTVIRPQVNAAAVRMTIGEIFVTNHVQS